jgi:hypothetical protein
MGPGFAFKMAISTVALALGSLALVSTAAAKSGSDRPLVLDAYSPVHTPRFFFTPPVSSRSQLARKHLYVATVRGSVSFYEAVDYVALQAPWQLMCGAPERAPMFSSAGGSGQVGNDAEFIFALPVVGHSCANVRLPRRYTNFQANVGRGWAHPNILSRQTPAKPNRSHTYEFALTGAGKPVSFRLIDPDTRDNYGSFRIYLRSAVTADCAGRGHTAFGLSLTACLTATANAPPAPRLPTVAKDVTLDQAPVARVLRSSDVPGVNQEAPSGALTASQFASLDNSSRPGADAETKLLRTDGFRSAAISEFAAPGQPNLRSTAVELRSPQQALTALQGELTLAARAQAPAGTTVAASLDTDLAQGYVVTFTPTTAGGVGGLELLAGSANFLYTLRAVATPDTISRQAEEQLLDVVLARAAISGRDAGGGGGLQARLVRRRGRP